MSLGSADSRAYVSGRIRNVLRLLQRRALPAVLVPAAVVLVTSGSGLVSAGVPNSLPAPPPAVRVAPTSLNFGNTVVGKKISETFSVANTGTLSVNASHATVSSSEFSALGFALPFSSAVGQSSLFQVWSEARSTENVMGTFVRRRPRIKMNATSLNSGSAAAGTPVKCTLTLTNAGGANLNSSLVSVSGDPFGGSCITTRSTIAPDGTAELYLSFSPTTVGSDSGSITSPSEDPHTPTTINALLGSETSTVIDPTITTPPANQTVTAGQTATFTVVAAGTAPFSYQWQKNGTA
ncbi:MAG: choice-of-anchor D domain-containing protein, partial [Candidatus Acidiferrales bacterium]